MPPRVLIVDDREELRLLLRQTLAAAEPLLDLVEAADGEQALAVHHRRPAELVVTDLDMPVMNGIELIRRLRAAAPVPAIVVISGASPEWIEAEVEAELADLPFLLKPLALAELVRLVRERLDL